MGIEVLAGIKYQYLYDDNGDKKYAVLSINEWKKLVKKFPHLNDISGAPNLKTKNKS